MTYLTVCGKTLRGSRERVSTMGGGPRCLAGVLNTNLIDDRKGYAMKLTSAQVERTLTQFQGEAIPDNHPVIPQLNGLFGEHTFFLDSHGLNIVEPAEAAGSDAQLAKVVNVAHWSDTNRNRLEPHEPEPTDVVVTLEFKH
jgi:hypothetical protein